MADPLSPDAMKKAMEERQKTKKVFNLEPVTGLEESSKRPAARVVGEDKPVRGTAPEKNWQQKLYDKLMEGSEKRHAQEDAEAAGVRAGVPAAEARQNFEQGLPATSGAEAGPPDTGEGGEEGGPAVGSQAQAATQQGVATMPEMPAGPQAVNVPAQEIPKASPERQEALSGAYGIAEQGVADEGTAEADQLRQISRERDAASYNAAQSAAEIAEANDRFLKLKMERIDALSKRAEEVVNQKVDPDHFWSSRSVPEKIFAIAGLFLGGFSPRGNSAQQMISQGIDNDIRAQEANIRDSHLGLEEQRGLLADQLRIWGDWNAAKMATRAGMIQAAEMHIQSVAEKSSSPIVKARAQQEIGKLEIDRNKLLIGLNPFVQAHTVMVGGSGGGDPEALKYFVPSAFNGKGGFTTNDAERARDINTSAPFFHAMRQNLTEIQGIRAKGGFRSPQDQAALESRVAQMIFLLNGAVDYKRITPSENEKLQEILAKAANRMDPLDRRLSAVDTFAASMRKLEEDKWEGLLPGSVQYTTDPKTGGLKPVGVYSGGQPYQASPDKPSPNAVPVR